MFTGTSDHTIFECPSRPLVMERRWKSHIELAPNCPRCASSNTKFCYYNNCSLSQPRYFCKGCRRYWTKGGSLRNVPVGGGCRKSRRTKSARQADRLGLSYQMPSPGSTSDESNSTAHGVDIDLAAVFAKFLNQESRNEIDKINVSTDQDSSSSGASCTYLDLPPGSFDIENQLENVIFESQNPFDHFIDGAQLHEGLPPLCMDTEKVEEFLDQNYNGFELQALLGEEIGDDTMLSDRASLPNFEWQPIMQFQDFGSFSTDDHDMKIPSHVADDNWSSFDLSDYDILSRPWN